VHRVALFNYSRIGPWCSKIEKTRVGNLKIIIFVQFMSNTQIFRIINRP
jgi:hypothetical protein